VRSLSEGKAPSDRPWWRWDKGWIHKVVQEVLCL